MFRLLYALWQSLRFHGASKAGIADDQCVACDSRDLTSLGSNAYRCNACGYEGGSGLAVMQEQAKNARVDAMSEEVRRETARDDLLESHRLLTSALGTLSSASVSAALDIAGIGGSAYAGLAEDESSAKQQEMTRALGLVAEAQALMRDVSYKIGGRVGDQGDVGGGYTLWGLDIHLDNPVTDALMFGKIAQVRVQAQSMLQAVHHALYNVFGISPPQG